LQRKTRVDKDVRRTDRTQPFFAGPKNPNVKALRCICLSYTMYNFDLSYCQVHRNAVPASILTSHDSKICACSLHYPKDRHVCTRLDARIRDLR